MKHYSIYCDLTANTSSLDTTWLDTTWLDTTWLVYPYWKSVLPLRDIEFNTLKYRPMTVRIIKEDFNN